jgi:hypothetical protein
MTTDLPNHSVERTGASVWFSPEPRFFLSPATHRQQGSRDGTEWNPGFPCRFPRAPSWIALRFIQATRYIMKRAKDEMGVEYKRKEHQSPSH